MNITKFVLKRPITCILLILSIAVFGVVSLFQFKIELQPEISMPMYMVSVSYRGASPEDVDKNVVKPLETELYNLSGVKNITCRSMENRGTIMLEYNYGHNMDEAYNDLKKRIDEVVSRFDTIVKDAVGSPTIFEMDMNARPCMRLAVRNKVSTDIYNYVTNTFVKEIEKISDVQEVSTSGGRANYIRLELNSEVMNRYGLTMSQISNTIKSADFSTPGGNIDVGNQQLSISTGIDFDTVDSLKKIPIQIGNGSTLLLEDLVDIYQTKKDATAVGRYDGEDCMIVSITKAQSASAVSVSNQVKRTLNNIKRSNPNVETTIVTDDADNINASIRSVFQTMIVAIILSMLIIFIFMGDIKASLIVGTSIPFSILTSLIGMNFFGFSLNLVTMTSLVLGVGMMVDNSIVVIEACFRAKEDNPGNETEAYIKTAIEATKNIGLSVLGSTLTTVVVFVPLGFMAGMSGQFFKPLGFTIACCMLASFISAVTVVPLCYVFYKPEEKNDSLAAGIVRFMQRAYSSIAKGLLKVYVLVILLTVAALIGSFMLAGTLETELQPETDQGMIQLSISTKPSLKLEERDKIYMQFEEFLKNKPEVKHYVLSNSAGGFGGGGGQSLIATLVNKKDREKSTKDYVLEWKRELDNVVDCGINISNYSTSGGNGMGNDGRDTVRAIIESPDYNRLIEVNTKISKAMSERRDITQVSTSLDNAAPNIKISLDPILTTAEGINPSTVGSTVYNLMSGITIKEMTVNGENLDVILEYPKGEFDSIEKLRNVKIANGSGQQISLSDIAEITFADSPRTIQKYNKKYRSEIRAYLNENATPDTKKQINEGIVKTNFNQDVTLGFSTRDANMAEEFKSLAIAIFAAVFLVFIVMATQFESIKYSLMVMTTVLFSFIGAIVGLWVTDLKISMVGFLGLLMLVGTAVNNGILYVDTVNQMRSDNEDLNDTLVNAGALRLRPILMTTLTTIVAMIPMAMAYGENGESLQSIGVVDIGGLISSTLMALFVLPLFYRMWTRKDVRVDNTLGKRTNSVIEKYNL